MNIEHISVSRKQCYDLCHQQYKYKYHLKVIPSGPTPFYFTYGNIVHKVAEEYVKANGKRQITEVAADIMRGKILLKEGTAPKLEGEYHAKFPQHLRAIKKLTERIGFDGELEWPFYFDLDPPNKYYIKGFIDRLINRQGKFFLIDYKTSKKGNYRKTATTILDDLQLRVYARIVQKEFGAKAEDIRCALFYVDNPVELFSTKYSQESLSAAEEELKETYRQIATKNPDEVIGNVDYHCQRCSFSDVCPFFAVSI